jgi:dsDNA-specific endonuclease/ATPase MutS2
MNTQPTTEVTLEMQYLSHNLDKIKDWVMNDRLTDSRKQDYAKMVNILEDLMRLNHRMLEDALSTSDDASEVLRVRHSVEKTRKLELIALITRM